MRRLRLWSALFLAAALVALAAVALANLETLSALRREAGAFAWRVHVGWLGAATVAGVAPLLMTAGLWWWLFRRAGGSVGAREGMAAWLGSNLGRYLPGKIWQLSGLAAYVRARGDSASAALATSIAAQAIVLATGIAIGLALAGVGPWAEAGGWRLGLLVTLLIGLAHPAVVAALTRAGARVLRERHAPSVDLDFRTLASAVLVCLGVWVLYGVGLWALVRGLTGSPTPGLGVVTGIFAASYVAGYLVLIAPGGLLVREGAMTALLAAAGLPVVVAGVVAIAARLWVTLAELLAFTCVALPAGRGMRDAVRNR